MDLPIKIIITLFVAVVVGGAIILFAQRTINKSEQSMQSLGMTPEGAQVVQITSAATANDVQKLAAACRRMSIGSVDPKQCFVVRGTGGLSVSSLDGIMAEDATIRVTAAQGATALFIDSDPRGKIIISS